MLSLDDLRLKHPRFYFDQAVLDQQSDHLIIRLHYHFEAGPAFESRYLFPQLTAESMVTKDQTLLKVWAAQLGMVEGLSYWKAACSPEWVIKVPGIYAEQFPFWLNLLHKGMSEFFYIHQINGWEDNFVTFKTEVDDADQLHPEIDHAVHQHRILFPVGGGKDSVVSSELLRQTQTPMTTFTINEYPQQQRVVETFWQTQPNQKSHITVQRQLDPQILDLNAQGYLNGHTPFNAMAAFLGTFAAYAYDYTFFPVSNEWSANEGNTVFLGQSINHQYSKTVEFEEQFRSYQQQYLSKTIEYFSYLRPLHELQIASLFTQFKQYWPVFLSCNRGQKTGTWCGECPKCLFVAVLLAAFLTEPELDSIFKKDILNNQELRDLLDQLAGFTDVKSLECVGTRDETRAALALAADRLQPLPELIQYGWQKILDSGKTKEAALSEARELLVRFVEHHFIPSEFVPSLKDAIAAQRKL
ncbi:hypothetical protein H3C66_05835 [Patescibacteria group bacterium]|nr:hypothetical protein [Patescibacteria group bacterium]